MKSILLCEDEAPIRELVAFNLQRNGYKVLEAASGEDALRLYEEYKDEIGVALLDVMLPGMDGFTVCRELRQRNAAMGIMMLTARTRENEKIAALKMGADDYVTKPFSPSELLARVEALHRRVNTSSRPTGLLEELTSGVFTLHLRNRSLTCDNTPVELTQVEFQILEFFFEHAGSTVSRTDLLKAVWGEGYVGEEKIVDVNIRRLRMKIEKDSSAPRHILTVWGEGYRWEP